MTQPPSESGNVVDPEVLASRRARRAEVSEDASLEIRLLEAERRLGEVAAERAALAQRVQAVEGAVAAVRARLGDAARGLREQVDAERAGRAAAESALGAERTARVGADRALDAVRGELEVAQARVAELE